MRGAASFDGKSSQATDQFPWELSISRQHFHVVVTLMFERSFIV
jgi:hypothetical protein